MTVYYPSSAYGITRYVSGQKTALSYDSLQLFANLTQGGPVPFYVRYQYSWKYIETSKNVYQWGPLDETLDKIAGTPGLRCILNLAYAPAWWQAIDVNGNLVGYNAATAALPDGPAMAAFATKVTQRYTSLIQSGILIPQICNEELDTGLGGTQKAVGGTIGAHLFNYAKPAIKAVAPNATVILGSVRPLSHPSGGQGTLLWMQNFWNYLKNFPGGKYYPGSEPGQSIPDAHDFHYYRDSATITSNKNVVAPDPATTDNSDVATNAVIPSAPQVVSIMQSVIGANGQSVPIWNLENGFNVPNNSPLNHNNSPTETLFQQDRYTLTMMAQLWNAGATQYDFYSALTSGNDPRALTGTALTDLNTFISTNPQWTGAAPTQYLYTSIDQLDFEGTTSTKPPDQYFAIMNPTNASKAWSIGNGGASWLTAVTLPTNGIAGTHGANLTSGTLAPGQCITLKCTADSTANGLSVSALTTGTLTVTVGAHNQNITVNLFVANVNANPNLTSGTSGPANALTFSINAGASAPATQTFSFKNADAYAVNWNVFSTGHWLSCATAGGATSGTLAGNGASQTLTVTLNSNVSAFAPSANGSPYTEVITITATPHPTPYDSSAPPAATPYITIYVKLTVHATPTANVQVSASALQYTAVASGSLPANQTFYFLNCSNNATTWTAAKTQSWLSLDKTSGSLPKNGTSTGTSPDIQHTDYQVITASVNTTAKPAGTYTDTITVTTTVTGGGTSTQTIPITYVVTSTGSTMTLSAVPTTVNVSQVAGGTGVPTTITLTNSGNTNGTFTSGITYNQVQTGWLSVNPSNGTINGSNGTATTVLTCTPGTLAAGTYTASVLFSPSIGASTATVTVTFKVNAPSNITASPTSIPLSQTVGGANVSGTSSLSNSGASGNYTSTITYSSNGSGWLSLTNGSGTLGSTPQTVTFTAATGSLTADTYTATVKFTLGTSTATVTVTFVVSPVSAGSLTVSPATLTPTAIQNGSSVAPTATLSNSGASGTYTSVTTYTSANGSGWLTVSPSTTAITTSQVVTFTCNPGSLAPDNYTAKVVFTLGATTAQVNITFSVSSSASPTLAVFPPTTTFTDTVGANSAVPQTVTLSNTGSGNGTWGTVIAYNGTASGWIGLSPDHDTLNAGASEFVTITMVDASLKVGTYTASITFSAGASVVSTSVTLIMSPAPLSFATSGTAQMTQGDLIAQYGRIMANVVGPQLETLATTYYTNPLTSQVIYGELDALFPYETMAQLHVMKTINDVTAFLNAYSYVANELSDGPMVYYRFGEASGINAYDISGRSMTATLSNTGGAIFGVTQSQPSAIPASADTSYLFDGTSGYVALPPAVNTANWPALSVEALVNFTNITFTQTAWICGNDDPASTNLGFMLGVTKNSVVFRIGTGSAFAQVNQPYTFTAGAWYHLAGVFNGTSANNGPSLTAYVNGNVVGTTTLTSAVVAQNTNVVQIAAKPGSTANNFPGLIDEPNLFKAVLSALRVQAHYLARLAGIGYAALVLSDGPLAFWRCQETSGTVASDSSGNGRAATLSGSGLTYSLTGIVTGGAAIGFGAYDSLVFPSSLILANYTAYSLEYWINLTSGWQYIAITVDSTGNTLYYLNGSPYTSGSGDSVVVDIDLYYTGAFAAGSLTEIAPYGYVLSPAQISNHYQIGSLGT